MPVLTAANIHKNSENKCGYEMVQKNLLFALILNRNRKHFGLYESFYVTQDGTTLDITNIKRT